MESIPVSDIRVDIDFAERLPLPPKGEFEGLLEDVRERGIVVPLVVTRDGLLLDGHRRLAAARNLGLERVPVSRVALDDDGGWERSVAIATNLHRRHLNEAQRADLGSSLLRVEREKAEERKAEGRRRGGRAAAAAGRRDGDLEEGTDEPGEVEGNGDPQPVAVADPENKRGRREPERATDAVARRVGVSRKTLERVERVKKSDPALAARMLEGRISVAGAAKKVRVEEIKSRAEAEPVEAAGLVSELESVAGRYRCIYADPPWQYRDASCEGAAEAQYPTASLDDLSDLPIRRLAHPDGAFLWMWTTWPMIRDGVPRELLIRWGYRWVGEIVWHKPGLGVGRWLRPATEVLILAVKGKALLLSDSQPGYLEAKKGRHSAKPPEARALVESLCVGPRIELFAREPADGWDRWGLEA